MLELSVTLGDGIATCPVSRARIRRLVLRCLESVAAPPRNGAMVSLLLCDRKEARRLNNAHRSKTYVPNVLSFEYPRLPGQPLQADIALCLPVVADEALKQGKTLEHHFMHLLVHGCLHALGMDHLDGQQAEAMEQLEREILRRFRIADPYSGER